MCNVLKTTHSVYHKSYSQSLSITLPTTPSKLRLLTLYFKNRVREREPEPEPELNTCTPGLASPSYSRYRKANPSAALLLYLACRESKFNITFCGKGKCSLKKRVCMPFFSSLSKAKPGPSRMFSMQEVSLFFLYARTQLLASCIYFVG